MDPRDSTSRSSELSIHAPWIRSLALRLVRDAARADDLVQETLLAALVQHPRSGKSLRPWLRSVLNKRFAFGVRSEARRRDRERASASHEEQAPGPDLVEEAETHARLVQSLTRLRDPYRTVLLLRYYEGLMPGEIAQRLELPGATVRSHLMRGLAELRVQLDGEHDGDRRAWCVALVPLAAGAPDPWTFTAQIASALQPLRSMHPLIHVVAASSALLLAGTFVAERSEEASALIPAATEADAEETVVELAEAPGSAFARAPGVVETGAAIPAGSTAPLYVGEFITGHVRDARTGAPLPGFVVGFGERGDPAEIEHVLTDEAGHFESTQAYATGMELLVRLRDLEVLHVTRTQRQSLRDSTMYGATATCDPASNPYEFKASVGPTFKLALDAPFDVDPEQLVATLESSEHAPWGPLSTSHQLRAPVRAGDPLWTRFSLVLDGWFPEERPWLLRVESIDGLWAGSAQLPITEGVYPQLVPIELTPAARLEVQVVAASEFSDLFVSVTGVDDGVRKILDPRAAELRADGDYLHQFELSALSPGTYQIAVSSTGLAQDAGAITLLGGQTHVKLIELAETPTLSFLRGELRSLSGQYKEWVTLRLKGANTGTRQVKHIQPSTWEDRDGVLVAPFVFDNLPMDTYSMQLASNFDNWCWSPLPDDATPPRDDLVLTCRDTDPLRRIEIQISDASTGAAVPVPMAFLTTTCCNNFCGPVVSASASIFRDVPADVPFTWWTAVPGYIPRFGDQGDLVIAEDIGRIEVELQPGWGARISAIDSATSEPLAGVAVLFDGVLFGSTDAEGRINLFAASEPGHIALQLEGWHAEEGHFYDPLAGQLTGNGPLHSVAFSAEP